MSIDEGLKTIDEVVKSPVWDMRRLISAAIERANRELTPPAGFAPGIFFGLAPCQTFYGTQGEKISNEMLSWFLGIMFAEYTAGILAEKVRDGHCNEHRKEPDLKPCVDMASEHKRMLTTFKDRMKKLVTHIEALEQQTLVPTPLPAPGPVTRES